MLSCRGKQSASAMKVVTQESPSFAFRLLRGQCDYTVLYLRSFPVSPLGACNDFHMLFATCMRHHAYSLILDHSSSSSVIPWGQFLFLSVLCAKNGKQIKFLSFSLRPAIHSSSVTLLPLRFCIVTVFVLLRF